MNGAATPHVLVVDDDHEVREVLKDLLSIEGFPVSTAAGGLPALLRIGRDRPDCIVIDVKMDDLSGFELCRVLQEDPDFSGIPILLISGAYADGDWVRRQIRSGTVRYLAKPIIHEDLVRTIRSMVS